MNNEKQRIAIAEACGWTAREDIERFWRAVDASGNMTHELWMSERNVWSAGIPDFLSDLNAMHEAEQILWGMDWSNRYAFNDNLANTLKGRTVNRNEWDAETLLDATAAQRAEAFLRTIGKWAID